MDVFLKPPADLKCPEYKDAMENVCPTCVKWRRFRGLHPLTGEELDGYQCTDVMATMATFEVAKLVNQAGAAVESTRNEVVKRMNIGLASMVEGKKPGLLSLIGGRK